MSEICDHVRAIDHSHAMTRVLLHLLRISATLALIVVVSLSWWYVQPRSVPSASLRGGIMWTGDRSMLGIEYSPYGIVFGKNIRWSYAQPKQGWRMYDDRIDTELTELDNGLWMKRAVRQFRFARFAFHYGYWAQVEQTGPGDYWRASPRNSSSISTWALVLPYWILPLVMGAIIVWSTLRLRRIALASRRRVAGLCPACGYDLRATPDRCPECGREFDGPRAPTQDSNA